ncbi:MAG: Nif3-like dinuclear metal center hexameric protein [Chromatiales bacterium]|nr:Nif3-like dinuclear metal center hexameric protein [Chromatiales bacterium]
MPVKLSDLVVHCNQLLQTNEFDDYCPNGLQVDAGQVEIKHVVTGVTASQALIDAAVGANADLLLVHHGFFWKGEPAPLTGLKGNRVRALIQGGVSLLAYHLPLDAHPQLGNNRRLGELFGFDNVAALHDKGLIWGGFPREPMSPQALTEHITDRLGREPLHIAGGDDLIRQVGWCTGAAQSYIEQAVGLGCGAFISGEISEQTVHLARELGVHYFAAGHHATERYGVQALGEHLVEQFGVSHQYIDIDNPV